MKIWLFSCLQCCLLLHSGLIVKAETHEVVGVRNPIISLNGIWKISTTPPVEHWRDETNFQTWANINVPGECQMQGIPIKHDQAFVYKRKFFVPMDFTGKHISLNFFGVYSYARVWINGHFIRDHFGGFTKWECDITPHVVAGDSAAVTVEVTDRTDDISYASGYAKHQIGGILRKVELCALPFQHFKDFWVETDLDENYRNATLSAHYELSQKTSAKIRLELFDKSNRLVCQSEKKANNLSGTVSMAVEHPKKWDAEHPNLYRLTTTLVENGIETLKTSRHVGFREIVTAGNQLLVNGKPIKLRGACRHDIHPLMGRTTTPEYDQMDVLLAKEANMNFIRTSHYPPSETFLEYCDQYGIYVEDETAVCFVGSHRMEAYRASGASQDDPLFTGIYLSQLREQVQNHRNHPSILFWSIGNENVFGKNFVASYDWVKKTDPTRPVIFSYPGQVPDSTKIYDLMSMHYPDWKGDLQQYGINIKGFSSKTMPVLFDEWAHVACYDNEELKYDPNVRNFWGQSLDSMWTNCFEAEGALGGAIWGMIDETFMLPKDLPGFNQWWGIIDPKIIPSTYVGPCVGYGEWGILDTWRRKKPEFWNTRKAYSPAKIYQNNPVAFVSGKDLSIPIHNRFDHTNFNELKIVWQYGKHSGQLNGINLEPHEKGHLIVPVQQWTNEKDLELFFYQNDTALIDNYSLQLGIKITHKPVLRKGALEVEETKEQIKISGKKVEYHFNKMLGILENVSYNGKVIIQSGPYLNLNISGKKKNGTVLNWIENWKCNSLDYKITDGIAIIHISGISDSIPVKYTLRLDEYGLITVDYQAEGVQAGKKLQEAGICFITKGEFEKLSWNRDSYFSGFPSGCLGSPEGEIDLQKIAPTGYREKPEHNWEMDVQNFYYHGLNTILPFPNIARSLKENIRTYRLQTGKKSGITVISNGNQAARYDKIDGNNLLIIDDQWDYQALDWGNYLKYLKTEANIKGQAIIQFH